MAAESNIAGHHDLGGQPAGPVVHDEHEPEFWEKRVDAMLMVLAGKYGLLRVDEMRRGIEQLPGDAYRDLSYYERWIASLAFNLVDKGILQQPEIDARVAELQARRSETAK